MSTKDKKKEEKTLLAFRVSKTTRDKLYVKYHKEAAKRSADKGRYTFQDFMEEFITKNY